MKSLAVIPAAAEAQPEVLQLLPVLLKEARRRPVLLAAVFSGIALLALLVGVLIPKQFTSSTTILVQESNIIGPLMEGRAVPTGVADRAGITREVAFSRKVMHEILKTGGWLANNPSPVEQAKLVEKIISHTKISNPNANLIQIDYSDPDPQRAYEVTKRYAELVMQESLATKERESREAYEFIDSQVSQYHDKLSDAEKKLEQYREQNPDARPGTSTDVAARIGELRRQVEGGKVDLIDLRSQEAALLSQISGQSEISMVQSRAGQMRARLADLMSQRDQLLLTYTDRHPDVVRVQHQIADLQQDLQDEVVRERTPRSANAINDSAEYNPLYAELKSKLAEAQRRTAAMSSRVAIEGSMLGEELKRSSAIDASEGALAELTRDYEVNRDLYQDLLKRRENARVSMNLDAEHRGLSFRIQEPASVPVQPSGIRLLWMAIAGLVLATIVPVLLLFGLTRLDPRVRMPAQLEREAGLPLLGIVPAYHTRAAKTRSARRLALATAIFATVPLIYGLTMTLRWMHQ